MNRLGTLIVLASIGLGIPALASAQGFPWLKDLKTVETVKLVSTETTQIVKLPPNTRTVNLHVSGGSIFCHHLMGTRADGNTSSWMLDQHFRDKADYPTGIAKGYPGSLVSVTVKCKSDGARSSIVVTASPITKF